MDNRITRRDFGKFAVAGLPLAAFAMSGSSVFAQSKPDSNFEGVHIGVITYSFAGMQASEIIPSMVKIGLSNCELMSNHAESLAGAPAMSFGFGAGRGPQGPQTLGADGLLPRCQNMQMVVIPEGAPPEEPNANEGRGRGGFGGREMTPDQRAQMEDAQKKLADWRASATPETWKGVRKQFDDAGIDLRILCYNMAANISNEDIDYAFRMARDLGVQAISSTSTVPVAKRVAYYADKYKIMWGGHGHDDVTDPIQFATPASFEYIMSFSPYIGVNLDIGHFTAAGFDAVSYIREHHARITNIHLKDRKKSSDFHAIRTNIALDNYPWGEGDTPIKQVLQLMKTQHYEFPADIEYEYECRASGTPDEEIAKCLAYAKKAIEA
ncbi:MAG TPA: sugar phosphate isomerase/epimerase [Candidatus Aquilonibacter sp.]|nr:sugar phosphate isomerase/epimerase [Candidatus Aquilonibacter sp.]